MAKEAGKDSEPRLGTRGDSLFMLAYRCWHAGFDYGDAECWQYAWVSLSHALGTGEARPVLGALEDFVRTLRAVSGHRLDYYPPPCCRMSRSEQQALELVAALQSGAPDVDDLIEDLCGDVTEDARRLVLTRGRTLALCLLDAGIPLQPPDTVPAARLPLRSLH